MAVGDSDYLRDVEDQNEHQVQSVRTQESFKIPAFLIIRNALI